MLQGFFHSDPRQLTPEQVERLLQSSGRAAERASDTSPVAHWTAGMARIVDALGAYRGNMRAQDQEQAGMAGADERMKGNPVLAALMGGDQAGMSAVPGMQQGMPREARIAPGADAIRAGLVRRGLPEHVADAFVMNFQDESGLNPGINESKPLVPGSRGGFGLAQWTGPRRKMLEAFAQQRGAPVSDMDTQLDFLMTELQGSEAGAARSILSAQDAPTAAAAIVNKFLRPAEEHRARREASYLGGSVQPSGGMSMPSGGMAPQQGPSAVIAALAQAKGDPWVAKKYGPVIDALMQQEMGRADAKYQAQLKQSDPMYQAQLQQQQMQNQQMMNPQIDPWAGTQVINGQVVGMGPNGPQIMGDFRTNEQYQTITGDQAAGMGLDPRAVYNLGPDGKISQIGGAGVTVNLGDGAPGIGKLSTDYGYVLDPATGLPRIDPETGLPTAAPVPGSPAARDISETQGKTGVREANAASAASVVLQDIDRAIEGVSAWTAGAGSVLSGLPGTQARNLSGSLDTIKANIGFDRIQQMREASPTGGALGQVAVQELAMLQAVLGSLDQAQSPTQLRANLERLKQVYGPIARKAAAYPNAAEYGFGGLQQDMPDDDLIRKYGG